MAGFTGVYQFIKGIIQGRPLGVPTAQEYGAKGDGVTDDTAAIQRAINEAGSAWIPPGMYRIDGTISLSAEYNALHLARGATLKRISAYSAATTPVVNLLANYSRITGDGLVNSENASPDGVVCVGPTSTAVAYNVNFCKLNDFRINGVQAAGNVGLAFRSSQTGAGGATYAAQVRDIFVSSVGTAVQIGEACNAHVFSNVLMYLVAQYGWHLRGTAGVGQVLECSFWGGFIHQSSTLTAYIKAERALYCMWYGMLGEPGGAAKSYDLDAACSYCHILGYGNMAGASANAGANNTILNLGTLSTGPISAASTSVPVGGNKVRNADSSLSATTEMLYHHTDTTKGAITIGPFRRDVVNARQGALAFEVTITGYRHTSTGTETKFVGKWLLHAYNGNPNGTYGVTASEIVTPTNVTMAVNVDQTVTITLTGWVTNNDGGTAMVEVRRIGASAVAIAASAA